MAFGCQRHAARFPHQKNNTEVDFELFDPLGHCPAREVQVVGRALKVAMRSGCRKHPQGIEVYLSHIAAQNR